MTNILLINSSPLGGHSTSRRLALDLADRLDRGAGRIVHRDVAAEPFLFGLCGHCSDLISISENENDPDLRRRNFVTQTGEHTVDLIGPAGTTVTLFGDLKHGLSQGYLIVTKQDDQPIALTDLGSFPQRRWVEVAGSPEYGAYRVWYQPYNSFSGKIFSVRWGQWWEQLPPAN